MGVGKYSCCVPGVLRQARYRKPFPSVLQAALWDQEGHVLPSAESDSQESPSPQGCLFSGRKAGFAFTLSMRSNESPPSQAESPFFMGGGRSACSHFHLPLPFLQLSPTFQPHSLPMDPSQPQDNGFPRSRPQHRQACLLTRTIFLIFSSQKMSYFRRLSPQPPVGPASNLSPKQQSLLLRSLDFVCTQLIPPWILATWSTAGHPNGLWTQKTSSNPGPAILTSGKLWAL